MNGWGEVGEISEHGSKCFGLDDSESWHLILYQDWL